MNSADVEADRSPWKAGWWRVLKAQLLQQEKHLLISRHGTPKIDYFPYHFSLSFPLHECGERGQFCKAIYLKLSLIRMRVKSHIFILGSFFVADCRI